MPLIDVLAARIRVCTHHGPCRRCACHFGYTCSRVRRSYTRSGPCLPVYSGIFLPAVNTGRHRKCGQVPVNGPPVLTAGRHFGTRVDRPCSRATLSTSVNTDNVNRRPWTRYIKTARVHWWTQPVDTGVLKWRRCRLPAVNTPDYTGSV